ncbi:hypothetical protein A71_225 [Escherichia phage A7_1]|nr:hypothetical protein A71_225 [Escherichia phage A7_1]
MSTTFKSFYQGSFSYVLLLDYLTGSVYFVPRPDVIHLNRIDFTVNNIFKIIFIKEKGPYNDGPQDINYRLFHRKTLPPLQPGLIDYLSLLSDRNALSAYWLYLPDTKHRSLNAAGLIWKGLRNLLPVSWSSI